MEQKRIKETKCPFHPEGDATLEVDLDTGEYFCQLCGATGVLTPRGADTLRMEFRWWSFI